ncbi:MAG: hypothetical protein QW815_00060 [Nitrososphaerota archaeon]
MIYVLLMKQILERVWGPRSEEGVWYTDAAIDRETGRGSIGIVTPRGSYSATFPLPSDTEIVDGEVATIDLLELVGILRILLELQATLRQDPQELRKYKEEGKTLTIKTDSRVSLFILHHIITKNNLGGVEVRQPYLPEGLKDKSYEDIVEILKGISPDKAPRILRELEQTLKSIVVLVGKSNPWLFFDYISGRLNPAHYAIPRGREGTRPSIVYS